MDAFVLSVGIASRVWGTRFLSVVLFVLFCVTQGHAFQYGQTGGNPISGQLTVNVVDGLDGSPVEGAWVMVGSQANSPFDGNYGQTDAGGQIVFVDGALSGLQTVTAAKAGYRVITLVDVNADEITFPLELFTTYAPADPPLDEGIIVQGDVTNFNFTNNNGSFEVAIVRDTMDLELLLDFDVEKLFGPAVAMPIVHPTYGGTFDVPRNVYIPEQQETPLGQDPVTLDRTPYMLRLVEGETYEAFALRGQATLLSLLGVLTSGSIGQLLGALSYRQFGMTGDFVVSGPEPMDQDVDLTLSHNIFLPFRQDVSNLPAAASGWPVSYTRQTFLLALADMVGGDGSGPLALMNLVLKGALWSGGTNAMSLFNKTGVLTDTTYLAMGVASAFDSGDNPDPREGISGYVNRAGGGLGNPAVTLDGFFPFVNQTDIALDDGRILLFFWSWEGEQEGVDYIRCDLDALAFVDCDPTVEDCPVGREREYRDTNWTVLLPGTRLGFALPALPPGAPRALWLPDDEPGVTYKLDWKLSQYGLGHGAAFDFDDFVFSTHQDRVDAVTQKSTYFMVSNREPDPPWNVSPGDGQTGVSTTPSLQGSAFSDQDADSVHSASQWQVTDVSGNYGSPVYDSGEDSANLTAKTLPGGVLGTGTYYWRHRHKDDGGKWSDYSGETMFVTGGCVLDEDCDDGVYCNGAETCEAGSCEPGTAVNCDDSVGCTDDSCNEGTDSCDHVANNGNCNDGLWCNGTETCHATLDCQAGTPPDCDDGVGCTDDSCNEGTDSCDHVANNGNCNDGLWCNGTETCHATLDCQAGTPPDCDDGVGCTDDSCNEGTDSCSNVANNGNCNDGLWCNGTETCHATLDCQAGTPPNCDDGVGCTDDSCNEGTDSCSNIANNGNCNDGLWCNGTETCHATLDCQPGSPPDCDDGMVCTDDSCDEDTDSCENMCNAVNRSDVCCQDPVCSSEVVCRMRLLPGINLLLESGN